MNLMINSVDAMRDVEGARELVIRSQGAGDEQLTVCVSDTGVGLPPQQADQIFYAFFTTKPQGTGMGLIDQPLHRRIAPRPPVGGRQLPRGARFHVTLPAAVDAYD